VRFVTFNIRLGLQRGVAPIVDVARSLRPDLLALQEVGANWRDGPPGDTTRRIGLQTGLVHSTFVPTIGTGESVRYGHALLSRWPIRDLNRQFLAGGRGEPRAALSADIVGPEDRAEDCVRFVSTHLSHIDSERRLQGPEFGKFVEEAMPTPNQKGGPEAPIVVAGDLNEPRERPSPWMRELLASFDEAGRLDPAPTFENPVPERRIDYLLVAGAQWSDAFVADLPDLSDHRPVVADL